MKFKQFLHAHSSRRVEAIDRRLGFRNAADLADAERTEREAPLFDMGQIENVRAFFPDATDTDRPRH